MEEENETNSSNKKVDKSFLDHFSRVSSENEATRHKFGVILLKHLNETKDDNELRYAVVRLVRGLGASKTSSKVGYYATLVGLLQTCPSVSVKHLVDCMKKQLQTGDSKSEMGDVYTGQILACGALLHSDLFGKAAPEEQHFVLETIFAAGKRRSYLKLAASIFIADLISKLDDAQFRSVLWPVLRLEVLKFWQEQNMDTLYLLTLVLNRFPHVLKDATLKQHFGTSGLYTEENVAEICNILMNIPTLQSLRHPGYVTISQQLAKTDTILPFMAHLNDQLSKPNRNRILATSIVIKSVLNTPIAVTQLPHLLPDNFVRQTLTYYSTQSNDRDFQKGMTTFFDSVHECCKTIADDKLKVSVIKKLLLEPGALVFEKITKTKILQQVVGCLGAGGVKKLAKIYRGVIAGESEKPISNGKSKPWVNSERCYAAQSLAKLLGLACVQGEIEWKKQQLRFLIDVSIVRSEKYANVGVELSGQLLDIFYRALDMKYTKLDEMRSLLSDLVTHISSVVTPENYSQTIRASLTDDDIQIWQELLTIVNKLSSKSKKYCVVFHVLFLHMGLQLFKEREMASSALKELFLCYKRVKSQTKTDEPEWIEVVIDLFLNLLSHNSRLLRHVITSVFPHLCEYVTASGLHQILAVLDPNYEMNPLSKDDSDSETDESESDEDDDENENETATDKLRLAVTVALGGDADAESVDLDDMSESEGDKLNQSLADAFRQYRPNRGGKSKKQTKDEETATHFRVRALDLLEIYLNSAEPSMLACFEVALSLLTALEFAVRDRHQAPLQARLKTTLKKLTGLRTLKGADEITADVLSDLLASLLAKGTKSALVMQDMSGEIAETCVFVLRCCQNVTANDSTPKQTKKQLKVGVLQIVQDAFETFFKNRDCLIPYVLFKSIVQLNWDGNYSLVPICFEHVFDESTRPFRRSQALELLKIFYAENRLRHHNLQLFKQNVHEHELEFCDKVANLLDVFCSNPTTTIVKERFVYHVFNLLKAMLAKDLKNTQIDWANLADKIREYRSHVSLSKDAKIAYNQLCGRLGVSNLVKMKNKVIKLTQNEETQTKHKPQNPAESKRLKKQTRDLRLQSMSEGLSNGVSFDSLKVKETLVNGKRLNSDSEGRTPKKKRKA